MSRGYFPGPNSLDVHIEQALAFGDSIDRIRERLDVTAEQVADAQSRMDAAVADDLFEYPLPASAQPHDYLLPAGAP